MTFMNKTMAYKLYDRMISSKHHLTYSANKIKMYSKKKINLRYFLANFNQPVYLRNSSVYTLNTVPKRLPPPRWVHAWSWFHWTPSVGWWSWWNPGTTVCWPLGKPSPHHLTQLLFLYDISKFLTTFNENYSSPIKNTHSFSSLSPKKFNQVLE